MLTYFAIAFLAGGIFITGLAVYRSKNPSKSDDTNIKLLYSEYTKNVFAAGIAALIIGAILLGITWFF